MQKSKLEQGKKFHVQLLVALSSMTETQKRMKSNPLHAANTHWIGDGETCYIHHSAAKVSAILSLWSEKNMQRRTEDRRKPRASLGIIMRIDYPIKWLIFMRCLGVSVARAVSLTVLINHSVVVIFLWWVLHRSKLFYCYCPYNLINHNLVK